MKNILLISALLIFQCACVTQQPEVTTADTLLNYVDLAAEISVTHETLESTAALDRNQDDNSTD